MASWRRLHLDAFARQMQGKAQPVQRPQGKRTHFYRFLELPQVFAAVESTSRGVGTLQVSVKAQVGEGSVSGYNWGRGLGINEMFRF